MEEDGILSMDLGQVLLGDVDVGRGVGVHGLLPALQNLLLVVGLTQLHLVDFDITYIHNMDSKGPPILYVGTKSRF